MATLEREELESTATAGEIEPLIPGLPDEIAENCLLHLPFPYQTLARSVSSSWNRAISHPSFLLTKKNLSLSLPYLFVFAFHRSSFRLQWQAFDPRSHRWFILPPMPIGGSAAAAATPLCPPAFACAALPLHGELYVLGGMRSDTQTPLQTLISYRASTNSWTVAAPMPTPRSFFAAASIGGKIFAAGGNGSGVVDDDVDAISTVECYDPSADRWAPAARMQWGMSRYDAAVVGGKMYITEGWTWPFSFSPRGGVYDADKDTWEEMRQGMREGWTGVSVVLGDNLFVISEYGDCRVKVYDEGRDTWQCVGGGGVPCKLQKPFAVSGFEGRIYVVACGLDVGVGTVVEVGKGERRVGDTSGKWRVEWEVVKGPQTFVDLAPSNSQVLYA